MNVEKIEVRSTSFARLMVDIEQGRIRMPRFQRDFVWERSKIQELLDSMYREFPIGTIFLWEAPPEYNHFLREVEYLKQPPLDPTQRYAFVLDGQQRLTSLFVVSKGLTVEGEDYGKIVVDLSKDEKDEKIFHYRKPDNRRWVSVQTVLENDFEIFNALPQDEYRRRFVRCNELLTKYPFSLVTVKGMDINDAIEIFERINRLGTRLTRYDLIAASVLTKDFDLRERTEQDVITPLQNSSFGSIPETSIPQALALNIRDQTEHATQMSLKSSEVQAHWGKTVESFMAAVEFVRQNLGVVRADFLPYDAMIPVLQYYFYLTNSHAPLSNEHRLQLERWFWRTAFSERYSGSSQTRMTEDAAWIRALIEDNRACEIPITTTIETLVNASMSRSRSAIRNGILCLLNLQRPLHFESASPVRIEGDHFSSFTRAERHHIFPVGFLKSRGKNAKAVHALPNFCFIPAELNKRIGDRPPNEYLAEIKERHGEDHFERVMHSHLIPVDKRSGIWHNNYERFLKQRAVLLLEEIRRRCGIVEEIPEEQRNPVVDILETALREKIHQILSARYGEVYWKHHVPGDVRSSVEKRIESELRKRPGVSRSRFADPRHKLEFCDPSDYPKIILKNWSEFSAIFRSKRDLERYLDDFREFRNAVKHNRRVERQLELRAKASIVWLGDALGIELDEFNILGI